MGGFERLGLARKAGQPVEIAGKDVAGQLDPMAPCAVPPAIRDPERNE